MDRNHHLDKRAADIANSVQGDDDELLNTRQTAELIGVSTQWLEIGRTKGYGPPFKRLAPRTIRYERSSLRKWLRERAEYRCTKEYT